MTTWKIKVTTSSGQTLEHESTSFHSAVGWATLALVGRGWADDRVTITIDRDEGAGQIVVDGDAEFATELDESKGAYPIPGARHIDPHPVQ